MRSPMTPYAQCGVIAHGRIAQAVNASARTTFVVAATCRGVLMLVS